MNYIFGKKLKAARKEKKFTLEEVAKKLKVSKGYLSEIENGKRRPPSDKIIKKLAKILDADKKNLLRLSHIDKISEDIKYELHISKIITPGKYLKKKGKELSSILEEGYNENKKESLIEDRVPIINSFDNIKITSENFDNYLKNIKDYIHFKIARMNICFAIRLPDDSMYRKILPCFPKGSIVFFSRTEKIQQNDFIFIIYNIDGKLEKVFRQVKESNRGKITLKALNTKFRREIVISRKNIVCTWKGIGHLQLL